MEERTFQSALDVANLEKLPRVDSYYDKVHQRVWWERWMGFVSGLLTGGAAGALVGVGAAFIPLLFGNGLPELVVFGQSTALFAGLGSFLGGLVGTQVGGVSGAVAAGFEERERREKLEKIREKTPALAEKIERAVTAKAEAERPKSRWGQFAYFIKNSMVWPVIGVGLLAGAAIGAVLVHNPATAPEFLRVTGLLFPGAGPATAIASAAAITGLVGAIFAPLKGGMVTNAIGNATAPIMNGTIFERGKEKAIEPSSPSAALEEQSELTISQKAKHSFGKSLLDERALVQESKNITLH